MRQLQTGVRHLAVNVYCKYLCSRVNITSTKPQLKFGMHNNVKLRGQYQALRSSNCYRNSTQNNSLNYVVLH